MTFDARPYLKEIGRGKSARDLTRDQARELFTAIFDGQVDDLALGAALVALRIKGERPEELSGMMQALEPHVRAVALPARGARAVVIPTYNGARKMPNLVPLLALLLARNGVPVLLHGVFHEESRVSTFEILERLGHAPAADVEEAGRRLEESMLAAVPLEALSPALDRVLAVRLKVGLRNCGHTLAKLLLPQGVDASCACRLIAVTHPDFIATLHDYFRQAPANVFLMRGVEGEPVVRLHAPQAIEYLALDGELVTHLPGPGDEAPELPAREAAATADWTAAVLEGRSPVPTAIARQVALVTAQCRALAQAGRQPLRLVSSTRD